jgi:hypothetical protein
VQSPGSGNTPKSRQIPTYPASLPPRLTPRKPAFKVTSTAGTGILNMVFATDHPFGERITGDVYSRAMGPHPARRQKAQLQRRPDREESRGVRGHIRPRPVVPQMPSGAGSTSQPEHVPPHPPAACLAETQGSPQALAGP